VYDHFVLKPHGESIPFLSFKCIKNQITQLKPSLSYFIKHAKAIGLAYNTLISCICFNTPIKNTSGGYLMLAVVLSWFLKTELV
jgi:hypothetical protein